MASSKKVEILPIQFAKQTENGIAKREQLREVEARSRKVRTALIQGLKSKPCMDCHGLFPPCAMDFDHVRGVKYKAISSMERESVKRVYAEIAKCDLVCSNCHRVRTEKRRNDS